MIHTPISLQGLGLFFSHKTCFREFSIHIHPGSRIAVIGRNGCGKSTLLNILRGELLPSEGTVEFPQGVTIGYVPQIVEDFDALSGAERFHKALTQALSLDPSVLLLDEPTNHLDTRNRQSLMRMLRGYSGTLIIVSHDTELLRTCVDTLWHIDQERVHVFSGTYDDYRREIEIVRASVVGELSQLNRATKETHKALMKEQTRAKNSKLSGEKKIEQRKWPTITSSTKACRGSETAGRKTKEIAQKKEDLTARLSELRLSEVITPTFGLLGADRGERTIVSIVDGGVGYVAPILNNIHLSLSSHERLAIKGDNGSGKSTLVKAIMGDPAVTVSGQWHVPKPEDIGYLDQHYKTLDPSQTVLETLQILVPSWSHAEIRRHLNDFLFRKNEEVNALVSTLSGGERARLCLAQIAAKPPKLLILDEVTNNLDLETRDHVIQVLRDYPGAMIVISHDQDFLEEIGVVRFYALTP